VPAVGRRLLASAAAGLALLAPASIADAAVTVGSPLTLAPQNVMCNGITETNLALASGLVQVPFDGAVLRWRLDLYTGGGSHEYHLRVIRPVGGGKYTGAGTGPGQTATSAGVNLLELPSPLPVRAGDLIGVDCPSMAPGPYTAAAPPGSTYAFFYNPPLADNDPGRAPTNSLSSHEELINADVAPKPSSSFSFGTIARRTGKGTALLPVVVPGPGALALGGTGVKAQQAAGPIARKTVSAAGTFKLLVRARGKAKRKLDRTGKARVRPSVTYTPMGEISGDPKTQSIAIKLIKRR
jgi:hypothetical protein